MSNPLPPEDSTPPPAPMSVLPQPQEVQQIEDLVIGLAIQFIVAMMLANGQTEVVIPRKLLSQAMDKIITARQTDDGGFTVRIIR